MPDTDTARMVTELQATDAAVRAKGWVAPGLGVPGAPLGLLETAFNPLGGLAAAGLGWFMPLVSFLGEGLTQLQGGNGSSVSAGSRDFGDAGQSIGGVAEEYRQSATTQTAGWTGAAADEYRQAANQHADGIAGLGEASTGVGSAIIGAGQVVAQAIAEVTELIAEAVAQIVPILTQAIARAGETFGQSVVEAIPPCVGIAVEYALRIAAKLAALVASGENLMKLVQGGMAVVELIEQALSGISGQSVSAENQAAVGGGQQGGSGAASTADAVEEAAGTGNTAGSNASAAQKSSPGGGAPSFEGATAPSGAPAPGGSFAPIDAPAPSRVSMPSALGASPDSTTRLSGLVPPPHSGVPATSGPAAHGGGVSTGGAGVPTTALSGGVPLGANGSTPVPGARVGTGRDTGTARPENRQQPVRAPGAGGGTPGTTPMGAVGGARPAGEPDKEHQRKYTVVQEHEEALRVAPQVITGSD
ncbi:hypothetical protein UO65_0480 [Actinokineospora spheciospongiae]|uniref:Uncharacterized protein n=1 Tax=Actinokineospora spheciospongiae TaxID=909613 RepID=W7JDS3_9PSEU|nr:hypothetical protein [Actinokineospora spheciospongiae]EWC64154.1 hypothetical protein UO65_0480 [Actinokineospora spheciospongiae]